jgi:hypothetical protein
MDGMDHIYSACTKGDSVFHAASENCAETVKCLVSVLFCICRSDTNRSTVKIGLVKMMLADRTLACLRMISHAHIEI